MSATSGRAAILAVAAALAILTTACAPAPSGTPPAPSPTAAALGSPPTATLRPSYGPIVIDRTLLSVFPPTVAGIRVQESPEGEQDASTDAVLPTIASTAAAIVAVDQSTSDLVYALVVRVRPGALSDAGFRDWRDSYDEGACGGVSLVVGHAEAQIGGRTVYIGTCASGLRTYHVLIADKGLLISVSSTGDRHLGEVLVGDLRP